MTRFRRFLWSAAILVCTFVLTNFTGCAWFQPKQPEKPATVQEWISQPRVKP